MPSDGIFVGIEIARQGLIDHHRGGRAGAIGTGEHATPVERNVHGREIPGQHAQHVGDRLLAVFGLRLVGAPERRTGNDAAERKKVAGPSGFDSRNRADTFQHLHVECDHCASSPRKRPSSDKRMESTWRASNPGSTAARRAKLRISRPAPISRIMDSATSAITSAPRVKLRPPAIPRPPSFSVDCTSMRMAFSAGTIPNRIPVASERPG